MDRAGWLSAFEQVIGEQIAAARALAGRLEDEARVLLERDLDGLDRVTAAKQACIDALERVETERRALVATVTGGSRAEGLEALLGRCDPSGRAIEGWRELAGLIEACRVRNAHNGRLVALRRSQVLRSLRMLRGQSAGGTYQRSGATESTVPGRDLARA
ncbi:MAG: flagellar protein FlgN [Steroidobacteraceae bacterium]